MTYSNSQYRSFLFHVLIGLYLFVYLTFGFYTEFKLVSMKPLPGLLMEDFKYYERALSDALQGGDPYRILEIGPGYLYPPPALFIIEAFSLIKFPFLKASLYWTVNIFLLGLIPYGIAKHYGYRIEQVWYWYVICLGFAPFLELLHIGQINVITLSGIFMLFIGVRRDFFSSVGLTLAILTKVSPVLFFIYLISSKRWRVVVLSVIAVLVILGLSVLRYGILPVANYPAVLQWLTNQFVLSTNSQSFVAKLANLRDLLSTRFNQVPILNFLIDKHLLTHRILTFYILALITISSLLFIAGKQEREPLFIITALGMTLSPNVMWYHHYVFYLLPILIWIGWTRFNLGVTVWCLIGLLIIQIDRFFLTYGLLIHIFGHVSILTILSWQFKDFLRQVKLRPTRACQETENGPFSPFSKQNRAFRR